MGTNISAPKKQRNYLLDLLKVFFSLLVVITHTAGGLGAALTGASFSIDGNATLNPVTDWSYFYVELNEFFGFKGHLTIAIFVFLSGYWLINEFKKLQKRDVIGKGKDMSILGKYAAKTYASYWPYLLFGTTWGFLLFHVFIPEMRNIDVILGNLLTSIGQFLGLFNFGEWDAYTLTFALDSFTENFTISAENLLVMWNGPLWYMYGLIVCAPLFFALLLASEKITIFVIAPFLYTLYTMYGQTTTVNIVASTGLSTRWIQLLGPLMLGVWGWYITDWLKNIDFNKKGRVGLTIFTIVIAFFAFYNIKVFYGGMVLTDFLFAILTVVIISEKDYLTTGINKVLNHIPFMKYAGTISLGVYLFHLPIISVAEFLYDRGGKYAPIFEPFANSTMEGVVLTVIGISLVLCIPFYFIDKYWLKPLSAWVIRITKANEPVVIEAPKAEA